MKARSVRTRCLWASRALVLLLATFCAGASASAQAQSERASQAPAEKPKPLFSEADATRLLADVQQALEGDNKRRFLKLFDAAKMANFAAFQDQVEEFFEKYEAFRFRYHVTESRTDDPVGIALADVEMELIPAGANVPNVRRNAQLRLVTAWDGKGWKIVDWSPRGMLN